MVAMDSPHRETVDEIEYQGNADDQDHQAEVTLPFAFLTTTFCRTSATSSQWSVVASEEL
jgi:hypothetical protein